MTTDIQIKIIIKVLKYIFIDFAALYIYKITWNGEDTEQCSVEGDA